MFFSRLLPVSQMSFHRRSSISIDALDISLLTRFIILPDWILQFWRSRCFRDELCPKADPSCLRSSSKRPKSVHFRRRSRKEYSSARRQAASEAHAPRPMQHPFASITVFFACTPVSRRLSNIYLPGMLVKYG